ncbi:MAG: type II toxin-antitoxin system YafQ family toxin [Spirochaetes bacterium]|nr:type II toxin-antitoxin system YafQ family toxin [Spirochaetota bacterium]
MLQIERSNQFKKDLKRILKRGKDGRKIKAIIEILIQRKSLPAKNRDHKLVGNYVAYRECHIEPDWLLIYMATNAVLRLERTGSHSDLFEQR